MKTETPYYAVVFTSSRTLLDEEPYALMAAEMMELARSQPGFLGVDHAREDIGITVSYWDSLKSIAAWKAQARHKLAQEMGQKYWYESYTIRICRVEREYTFDRKTPEQTGDKSGSS
jgi:heme-degrading monooxygenase HmoA